MEKISVVGSCICRDLFNLDTHDRYSFFTDVRFTSPYTMVQEPVPDENLIDFSDFISTPPPPTYASIWYQKNLRNDINKIMYQALSANHGDWLIFDIADARIPICELFFNSNPNKKYYISASVPFNLHYKYNFTLNKFKDTTVKEIDPKEIPIEKWVAAIHSHIENLKNIFPPDRMILIENYCVRQYIDEYGALRNFEVSEMIQTSDKIFKILYDEIKKILPECHIIKIPKRAVSNVNNRWGKHPLHMDESYYQYLLKCIDNITTSDGNLLSDLYNEYSGIFKQIYRLAQYETATQSKSKLTNNILLSQWRYPRMDKTMGIKLLVTSKFIGFIEKNIKLRYYHYGINNVDINRFMQDNFKTEWSSVWLHPESLSNYKNSIILIDSLNIGKGISTSELCNIIKNIDDTQYVVILNDELNNKLILPDLSHNLRYKINGVDRMIKVFSKPKDLIKEFFETLYIADEEAQIDISFENQSE